MTSMTMDSKHHSEKSPPTRGSSDLVNTHSDVNETNEMKREYYEASWLDLELETRPEQETTLFEKDTSRRESYEQKQVTHILVQRSPHLWLRLGRQGAGMTEHQLPTPFFTPRKAASPTDSHRAPSPTDLRQKLKSIVELDGVCLDKQDVSLITKDLPKVSKAARVNFRASCLISPRDNSQSFQR